MSLLGADGWEGKRSLKDLMSTGASCSPVGVAFFAKAAWGKGRTME